MGPLGVELLDEVVEVGLLLQEIGAGRLGCLKFQCQMHALMAAVLLRVARLDALDVDTEPEPQDGEPRQIEQSVGAGERHSVVGSDRLGQAELFEDAFGWRENRAPRSLRDSLRDAHAHLDENGFRPGSFYLFLGVHPRSPEGFGPPAGHRHEGPTISRWLMAPGYRVRTAWTLRSIKPGTIALSVTEVAGVAVMARREGDRSVLNDSNHTSGLIQRNV